MTEILTSNKTGHSSNNLKRTDHRGGITVDGRIIPNTTGRKIVGCVGFTRPGTRSSGYSFFSMITNVRLHRRRDISSSVQRPSVSQEASSSIMLVSQSVLIIFYSTESLRVCRSN